MIIFVFSLVAVSPFHYFSSDGILYKEDIYLPVFSWKTQPYQWREIVKILLESCEEEFLWKSQPTGVSNNVAFLISNSSYKNVKNIACNGMGAAKRNKSQLKYFVVDKSSRNKDLASSATKYPDYYILKRIYN